MKKTILTLAVIAALPFAAVAENISGAMYTAPIAADTNHPAPTTQAYAPYGRIDIDIADQEHIATTAYVKGAYNSAIAAVNKGVDSMNEYWSGRVGNLESDMQFMYGNDEDIWAGIEDLQSANANNYDYLSGMIESLRGDVNAKRVEIYTTWDDDTAKQQVAFVTAQ